MSTNLFYVYIHLDNFKPVYVGKGSGDRGWNFSNRKNNDHKIWMRTNLTRLVANSFIKIYYCESDKDCLKLEADLIKLYRPKFNSTPERLLEQRREAITNRVANGLNAEVCSISVTNRNLSKVICPKCNQEGGMMAMYRWHGKDGEKCRSN